MNEALHYFREFYGTGDFPTRVAESRGAAVLGIVAPHIDLRVSSQAYAAAFRPLLSAAPADTYLILGVGHRSRIEWSMDRRAYRTPLGDVEVDQAAAETLLRESGLELEADPAGYVGEHSIEFPLVCLQAFRRLQGIETSFRYVPVLCGGLHRAIYGHLQPEDVPSLQQLGRALAILEKERKGAMQWILSIDGCHMGPRFDHEYRVTPARLKECAGWEEKLWELVERGDLAGFFEFLARDGNARYFDGVGALALFMTARAGHYHLQRTHYEQWFEPQDHSAVTFTSGTLTSRD